MSLEQIGWDAALLPHFVTPGATVADDPTHTAYVDQERTMRRRWLDGDAPAGFKIGFAAQETRELWGVDEPGRGFAWASRLHADRAVLPHAPGLGWELELGIVTAHDIDATTAEDDDALLRAIDRVAAAFELVRTRVPNPERSVPVWIGDNGIFEHGVVSSERGAPALAADVVHGTATLADGSRLTGSLDRPLDSLRWLARHLSRFDRFIPGGSTVLSGALLGPVPLTPGETVSATIDGLHAAVQVAIAR